MPFKLDKIEVVTDYKHLQVRELKEDGSYHRRVVKSDAVLSDSEHEEIKDKAAELWTDEVKEAWTAKQAENTPE